MAKKIIITTSKEFDILDFFESPKEWESLTSEQKSDFVAERFDENPCQGFSFDIDGDWSSEECDDDGEPWEDEDE